MSARGKRLAVERTTALNAVTKKGRCIYHCRSVAAERHARQEAGGEGGREEKEGIGVKTSRVSRFGYHLPQDCRVNFVPSALSIFLDFSFPFARSGFNSRLVFLRASARARGNCDA